LYLVTLIFPIKIHMHREISKKEIIKFHYQSQACLYIRLLL